MERDDQRNNRSNLGNNLQNARKILSLSKNVVKGLGLVTNPSALPILVVSVVFFVVFFLIMSTSATGMPQGGSIPTIPVPTGISSTTPIPGGSGSGTLTPPPGTSVSNACTKPYEGSGSCSVDNLKKYFNNETKALITSLICQAESGSDPFALNDNCGTNDYSVGLFQINLVAHCAGAYDHLSCHNLISLPKRDVCEQKWRDPDENIKYAVSLSGNGTSWGDWSTWSSSGKYPVVSSTLATCGISY